MSEPELDKFDISTLDAVTKDAPADKGDGDADKKEEVKGKAKKETKGDSKSAPGPKSKKKKKRKKKKKEAAAESTPEVDDLGEIIEEAPEPEKKSNKKLIIIIAAAVLLLVIAGVAGFLIFSGPDETQVAEEAAPVFNKKELYLTIGPIITKVGNAGRVRVTLELECESLDDKEKITLIKDIVEARLWDALQIKRMELLIKDRSFTEIREYISDEINSTIKTEGSAKIFFKEFVIY